MKHTLVIDMVAFYTKHSQRQSYKKKYPLGLPFSLFCLVRPTKVCTLSSNCCSKFWLRAGTQKVSQAEILSTNARIHMNGYGALQCTAADLWNSICHTNTILLIPVLLCRFLQYKKSNLSDFLHYESCTSGFSQQVVWGCKGI